MAAALGVVADAANTRLLQERIERTREGIAALQERVERFDALADTLQDLPKKLSHPVMVPLGKRAMMPGKIVRSNEVLAHLGDNYYAWRTVPSAIEIIDRKKKELSTRIREEEVSLKNLSEKRADVDSMASLKKMYDDENIREIHESIEESELTPVSRVTQEDVEEYFELEEEERRQNEQASWDWDEVMKRMEELEAAEEQGAESEEKPQPPSAEQRAAELKAKGNDAFARRKFKEAVSFYSQAIDLDPMSHVLYGNRSAAYHRFKKYEEALKDANSAIELDDSWVKGHYRKACALSALDRFEEAAIAFDRAYELCPADSSLAEKATNMRAKADSAKCTPSSSGPVTTSTKDVIGSISERQATSPSPPLVHAPIDSSASSFTPVVSARGEEAYPSAHAERPLSSSSAVFSGSIMEREIVEHPVATPREPTGPSVGSGFGMAPRTSRFAGNNPDGDRVTLQPVGEPQPVKRVSRFRAARAAGNQQ